ncbi:MAG: hypothetical protein RIG84_02565 [Roseovarius sp.]
MMTPERSTQATRLIVRTLLQTARPDQLQRLLSDILQADSSGEKPEAT